MKSSFLFAILSLVVVGGVGVVHGRIADRWGIPTRVLDASALVEQVPLEFGDWKGMDEASLNERTQTLSGALGYISRTYTNSQGDQVYVMLMCGRPGPISSHSPDVCFQGSGLRAAADPETVQVTPAEMNTSKFLASTFVPPATNPGADVRTYLGVLTNGATWHAISDGRVRFAMDPFLYRTFLTTPQVRGFETAANERLDAFLQEFLPILRQKFQSAKR